MTVPVVEALTPTTFDTDATAHLVAMPATVNADELLLMLFTADGNPTITTPSGWSIIAAATAYGTSVTAIVYGKKAVGDEDGTTVDVVTSASEQAAAQVYRISGWGGTLATDVVAGTPATGGNTNPDPPSASWTWGALDELIIASAHYSSAVTISAYPTNYTDGTFTTSGGGAAGGMVASARRALTAAASPENPGTFTTSGSVFWVTNTIAIKPLAVADRRGRPVVITQAVQRAAYR